MGIRNACSGSLPQFEAGGLTVGGGSDIDRLAVDQYHGAAGVSEAQFPAGLADQFDTVATALQSTDQHLAIGIGELGPAVGGKLQIDQRLTGSRSYRNRGAGVSTTAGAAD